MVQGAQEKEPPMSGSAPENQSLSLKWVLAGFALLAILAVAVIINQNSANNTIDNIVSGLDIDNGDSKINWNRYSTTDIELSDSLTITKPGIYHLTGTLNDGYISIGVNNNDDVVKLILDNVIIKNSNGPAIACSSGDDLVIELVGNNIISDGESYAADFDEDVKGAIYSKADLTFEGDGTLTLVANYQDGIVSKDDLKFNGGVYNITAVDDAIRGKDSVYIMDGNFTIDAKGDGIKSTNETDAGKGFVLIEKGTFEISSGDDGIHAIRTLVIHDGDINITKSYEGLEAQIIYINGGKISILSFDDGINAGGGSDYAVGQAGAFDSNANCVLVINGGDVYINASGDGIDSNGYIHFNGGKVVVDGPANNGNGALDAGISITMNGGSAIAIGASGMAEGLGTSSSIYNASIYLTATQKAGTKISIKNAAGETIINHAAAKTFDHIAVGTERFTLGETYALYLNGTEYTTFTLSDITTVVGNNANRQPNAMPPTQMQAPGGKR